MLGAWPEDHTNARDRPNGPGFGSLQDVNNWTAFYDPKNPSIHVTNPGKRGKREARQHYGAAFPKENSGTKQDIFEKWLVIQATFSEEKILPEF